MEHDGNEAEEAAVLMDDDGILFDRQEANILIDDATIATTG